MLPIIHVLNFVAPAFVLALLLVAASHLFWRPLAKPHGWLMPVILLFVVGCVVLTVGLVVLRRDGSMLTYAALVLVMASAHWGWLRAWR